MNQLKAKYSKEQLALALEAAKSGSMSQRKAAALYGIPPTTLMEKIRGRRSEVMNGLPKTVLTNQEEDEIAKWVIEMSRRGFGRTKDQLCQSVKDFLDKSGRSSPFLNNLPGKTWYYAFRKRHPEIVLRQPQALGVQRAYVSEESIRGWFDELKTTILGIDASLLLEPARIFNADESGFQLCPKSGQVLGMKGDKHVYTITSDNRTTITCLACASANNQFVTPMLIFPGKQFNYNPLKGFEEAYMGKSSNGYIDGELFAGWIKNVFVPQTASLKKPVLLFVDGHASHVTKEASTLCEENDVILYGLLPHSSHIIQPLDLVFFSSIKKSWRVAVLDYQESTKSIVSKTTFASVFKKAWDATVSRREGEQGIGALCFKKAGLFPLDVDALDWNKVRCNTIFSPTVSTSLRPRESTTPEQQRPAMTAAPPQPAMTAAPLQPAMTPQPAMTAAPPQPAMAPQPAMTAAPLQPAMTPQPAMTAAPLQPAMTAAPPQPAMTPQPTMTAAPPQPAMTAAPPQPASSTPFQKHLDELLDLTAECVIKHGSEGVRMFKMRYEEGFDVCEDECFCAWKEKYHLLVSSTPRQTLPPLTTPPTSHEAPCSSRSDSSLIMQQCFAYPQGWGKKGNKNKQKQVIPRLLSGKACRDLHEEKQAKKQREAELKEERKRMRMTKKIEKEESARKQKEKRELNRQEKERKKLEKQRQKQLREILNKGKGVKRKVDEDSSSDEEVDMVDVYDDDDDMDVDEVIASMEVGVDESSDSDGENVEGENVEEEQSCCGCKNKYQYERWLQCDECHGWWHVDCVKVGKIRGMSDEELESVDFSCQKCTGNAVWKDQRNE